MVEQVKTFLDSAADWKALAKEYTDFTEPK